MIIVEKKPIPIYEATCNECKSKIQYKKSDMFFYQIQCPVCGVWIWVNAIMPVRFEEGER